jgi:UDP-N-acetylglucosamine--N-acetylmuramyl-(pentapeptide) pyrophosphoryl-undecaprenol N-acetylglucosamine transferase
VVGLAAARPGLKLRVITGMRDFHWVKEQLRARPVEVIGFTDRPWSYLEDATLAVSRSGSNTVYELLTIGIPMILVPFPYATLDHQLANARYLEEKGAALVIEESQLSVAKLGLAIERLLENHSTLDRMRRSAAQLVIRDSARRIATAISNSSTGGARAG